MKKDALDLPRLLVDAREHLEARREGAALASLLGAWRACRHPRLADAVDRVSERLPHDPVSGRSVKERGASWLALAAEKDPVAVGRLLATPWPGTWKPALPWLEALRAFEDDPRIAMALCRLQEATPFDTYTSHGFYGRLLGCVRRIGDVRVLPLLQADLLRVRSSYWRQGTLPATQRVVDALTRVEVPALTKPVEAALGALEALFSAKVSALKTAKRSEAALLADVYAAPDDDAPRAVYADWLSERGDPRGELILLQLAGEKEGATAELRARERALLKKHAKAWLGPRETVLEKRGRAFRRGFLARGVIELPSGTERLGPELEDPAWSTLETLGIGWLAARYQGEAILALPWFRHVRALRAFPEALIAHLAEGGPREHLRELDVALDDDTSEAERARIWEGRAFPGVRHVALEGSLEAIRPLLERPLARRLERLTLVDTECPLGALVALAEGAGLRGLREVAVVSAYRDRKAVWRTTLRRDDAGRFTALHAEPDLDADSFPSSADLCSALASLEAGSLAEVTVSSPFPCDFQQADLLAVGAALARFPGARLSVPWEQVRAAEAAGDGAPVTAYYSVEPLVGPKGEALLAQLAAPPLSLALDAYEIYAGRSLPLRDLGGKPPFDVLREAFSKKRTYSVTLVQKTSPDVRVTAYRARAEVCFPLSPRDRGAFLDWVLATERRTGDVPVVPFFTRAEGSGELRRRELPHLGPLDLRVLWLLPLDADTDAWVPLDELEASAGKGPLAWLEVRRPAAGTFRLFVLGRSPTEPPTEEQLAALSARMFELLGATWRRRLGFLPYERVVEAVAPGLEALGFTRVAPEPDRYAHLARHFVLADPKDSAGRSGELVRRSPLGTCAIRLQLGDLASDEVHVLATAEHHPGRPDVDVVHPPREERAAQRTAWLTQKLPLASAAGVAAAADEILAKVRTVALPWFEPVAPAATPAGRPARRR